MAKGGLDATELIAEIAAYCLRTGTPPGYIGKVAFNHPGYVPLIRKRGRTSVEAAERARAVMADNPDGISAAARIGAQTVGAHRQQTEATLAALALRREKIAALPRVDRDPCRVCGARGDFDCGHNKGSAWGTTYG